MLPLKSVFKGSNADVRRLIGMVSQNKILCAQAALVLSMAGDIATAQRDALSPEVVDMIIVVKKNMDLYFSITAEISKVN